MIKITHSGDFKNTEKFFNNIKNWNLKKTLERYGRVGVAALSEATPIDTGKTADSWEYSVDKVDGAYRLSWTNSNESDGIPIAILIQYGHVTRGMYVQGRDFINPAIQPIIDQITNDLWKEVTS